MIEEESTTAGSANSLVMPPNLIASIYWDASKGRRLKSLRGKESMQSLAKRAGVAWQLIQRLEKSLPSSSSKPGTTPTVAWGTLESLCRALSITVEDFLQIQVIKNPKKLSETP
jgi:DNA-binding Xre family transcriptional regulator